MKNDFFSFKIIITVSVTAIIHDESQSFTPLWNIHLHGCAIVGSEWRNGLRSKQSLVIANPFVAASDVEKSSVSDVAIRFVGCPYHFSSVVANLSVVYGMLVDMDNLLVGDECVCPTGAT